MLSNFSEKADDRKMDETTPEDAGVPWLMECLNAIREPEKQDWRGVFHTFDPRRKFSADLCDVCYSSVTAPGHDGSERVHVLSKDEMATNNLMLSLHDGACQCGCENKTRFQFCLLDAIAASGSVKALRECVNHIQSNFGAASAEYGAFPESLKQSVAVAGSLPYDRTTPDVQIMSLPFGAEQLEHKENVEKSDSCVKSKLLKVYPECSRTQAQTDCYSCSRLDVSSKDGVRKLLSPNCGGGHGERETFPSEESELLEKFTLQCSPEHATFSGDLSHITELKSGKSTAAQCEQCVAGEVSDPGSASADMNTQHNDSRDVHWASHLVDELAPMPTEGAAHSPSNQLMLLTNHADREPELKPALRKPFLQTESTNDEGNPETPFETPAGLDRTCDAVPSASGRGMNQDSLAMDHTARKAFPGVSQKTCQGPLAGDHTFDGVPTTVVRISRKTSLPSGNLDDTCMCKYPSAAGGPCPLACCTSQDEVDDLCRHLDQASMLSMAVQAVYHNQERMMVCARALCPSELAELVRISAGFPATDSMLYLYFMLIHDKDKFSEVSPEDLATLETRTLPLEVSRLCQLAWKDDPDPTDIAAHSPDTEVTAAASTYHATNTSASSSTAHAGHGAPAPVTELTTSFSRAGQANIFIDVCKKCEQSQFPDLEIYGQTSYAKFRLSFHDNAYLFECIKHGGCLCPSKGPAIHKRSLAVIPACAAAAAGKFEMFRALVETGKNLGWEKPRKLSRWQPLRGQFPGRACTQKAESTHRRRRTVGFSPTVQHCGESSVGTYLRHALYGGSDDIVHYILGKMIQWPLVPDETVACLHMCLLMGRDDLFLRLTLQAGLTTVWSRDCRASTPLMLATEFRRAMLVNILLAMGADPLRENWKGETAVETALRDSYSDSEFITLRMLSVEPDRELEKLLIGIALENKKLRVAKYLISRGVRTTHMRRPGYTQVGSEYKRDIPLIEWWFATSYYNQSIRVLKFLLAEGLEVNTSEPVSGRTPLHMNVPRRQDDAVAELLISHGAKVNARTASGETPLFDAVRFNNMHIQAPLLKAGASLCPKKGEQSAFGIAVKYRWFQDVLLLLHAGYCPTQDELKELMDLCNRIPEPIQLLIALVRSEPLPLPVLCAASLREALQENLNSYLTAVGCPDVVRSFIHLEHLVERFINQDNWNRILGWSTAAL